jgi:hypothetical protein
MRRSSSRSAPEKADGQRDSRCGDRRLQQSVAPGLDRRSLGRRGQRSVPVRLAGEQGTGRRGLVDSYREVHPTRSRRPASPGRREVRRPTRTRSSTASTGCSTRRASRPTRAGWSARSAARDVDVAVAPPYPSDHRGVVSTLDVALAQSPVLVAVSNRRVIKNKRLAVTFHAPGQPGEQVRLVRHRSHGRTHAVRSKPTGPSGDPRRHVTFGSKRLKPGRYDARLKSAGGKRCRTQRSGSTREAATPRSNHVGRSSGSASRSRCTGLVHPAWVWTGSASSAAIA